MRLVLLLLAPLLPVAALAKDPEQAQRAPIATWPFTVSPIGNGYTTRVDHSIMGRTQDAKTREYLVNFGLISDKGRGVGTPGGDKVTLYPSIVGQAGTGDIWAINPLLELSVGSGQQYNAQGIELDLNNNEGDRGAADGGAGLAAPVSYGMTITGAGAYQSTAALGIFGGNANTGAPIWHRGLVFGGNSTSDATIQDLNNSLISLDIRGTHRYGADFSQMAGTPIRLGNGQSIAWRNAAGSADILPLQVNDGDNLILGLGAGAVVPAAHLIPSTDGAHDLGNRRNAWSGAHVYGVYYRPGPLPDAPTEGQCIWDAAARKLKCFDGAVWRSAW